MSGMACRLSSPTSSVADPSLSIKSTTAMSAALAASRVRALSQGTNSRYSNAGLLQVGLDRHSNECVIFDDQATGLICDVSAHDLLASGGQGRWHSLKLVRAV